MPTDIDTLWKAIDKGGILLLSVIGVLAFVRGWVVPSWTYTDLKTRCEKTEEIAGRATELAERTSTAAGVLINEIRQLQQNQQEENAARLLAEIKEIHGKVTRVIALPSEGGDKQ